MLHLERPALVSLLVSAALQACVPAPSTTPLPLHLVQANIGTALLACDPYVFKLCDVDAEAAIAASFEDEDADVIALQEVLPDRVCDAIDDAGGEDDPGKSCHRDVRALEPTQIERLLPVSADDGDWSVSCDARNGFECVAVRNGRAAFVSDTVTAPFADVDGCDAGFTVSRVDVRVVGANDDDGDDRVVRIVNGHPQSTKATCRKAQIEQIFDDLVDADDADDAAVDAVIVSGDMNLDPFGFGLDEDDVSVPVWSAHVGKDGDGKDFTYASGPAERATPYPTTNSLVEATFDHVALRGGSGVCVTLGGAPGTALLDGDAGAMDHRALDCALVIE